MDVRTVAFGLLLLALGTVTALLVLPLLQYVLAAGLLAFVLTPVQTRLAEHLNERIAAGVLTGLTIVFAIVPLLVLTVVILGTVQSFIDDLDVVGNVETVRTVLTEDFGVDEGELADAEDLFLAELEGVLSITVETLLLELAGLVRTSVDMLFGLLVLVFLLYYLLVDGDEFVSWVGAVAPIDDGTRVRLFDEVNDVTWAVIQSHVLVAFVEGILGGIGLYLLGVPNVAFWTVVMIVVSFLPAIGVWLVWGPAVAYLVVAGEPLNAILLLAYGVTVLSVVDNYLRAVFVDHGSGLHPAVVLVGVIGGIYLLGVMGLFLGPVLLAVFKAGLTVFGETYGNVDSRPSGDLPPE